MATGVSPSNDPLELMASQEGAKCFRGDENDVLKRFLDAAQLFGADPVIRICADNPFLSMEHLNVLLENFSEQSLDYLSFAFPDGTPIMRSHIGLFAEIMSLDLLLKLDKLVQDRFYREHVTNYIYSHQEEFELNFLAVPEIISNRRDIRLTVDTEEDFEVCRQLLNSCPSGTIEEVIDQLNKQPVLLKLMREQIDQNSK